MGVKFSTDELALVLPGGELSRLAQQLVRGRDSSDLVQDTIVAALSEPDTPTRLSPWLKKVLRNRFRDQLRRHKRRAAREEIAGPATLATGAMAPEDAAFQEQILVAVREAFGHLEPKLQTVLRRRFVDDDSAGAIAAEEGCSPATIRWRTHEAIRRLRADLDARFEGRKQWTLGLMAWPGVGAVSGASVGSTTPLSCEPSPVGGTTEVTSKGQLAMIKTSIFAFAAVSAATIATVATTGSSRSTATEPSVSAPNELAAAAVAQASTKREASILQRDPGPATRGPAMPALSIDATDWDECKHLAQVETEGMPIEVNGRVIRDEQGQPAVVDMRLTSGCYDPSVYDGFDASPCEKGREPKSHPNLEACIRTYSSLLIEAMNEAVARPDFGRDESAARINFVITGHRCGGSCGAGGCDSEEEEGASFPAADDPEPNADDPRAMLPPPQANVASLSIDQVATALDLPRVGASEVDVTVIECGAYTVFSRQVHRDLVRLLAADSRVELRWAYHSLTNVVDDTLLARAAFAAEQQGKFWEMHELLVDEDIARDRATMLDLARALSLDTEQFEAELDSPTLVQRIADQSAWCRAQGFTGTPAFLVGNKPVYGARGLAVLEQAVADARQALR